MVFVVCKPDAGRFRRISAGRVTISPDAELLKSYLLVLAQGR